MAYSRRWSMASGLTCSSYVAGRPSLHPAADGEPVGKGLATFTGRGVWVLNSGSFMVGEEEEATIVQFTLIRKHGASVLAFNLHLGFSREIQRRQLHDLFAHPLLREPYCAVALCTDRTAMLTAKQWKGLASRSRYTLHHAPLTSATGGLLGLFTFSTDPVSAVTNYLPGSIACPMAEQAQTALTMTFELERIVSNTPNRLTFPLSFRERWLGYREHRSFA